MLATCFPDDDDRPPRRHEKTKKKPYVPRRNPRQRPNLHPIHHDLPDPVGAARARPLQGRGGSDLLSKKLEFNNQKLELNIEKPPEIPHDSSGDHSTENPTPLEVPPREPSPETPPAQHADRLRH